MALDPNLKITSDVDLDNWIKENLKQSPISRQQATATTPLTNGKATGITGVHEVLLADSTSTFQCIYCAQGDFPTAISGRAHLVKHGDRQTEKADREAITESAASGKSIYAPYDTDDENVTFMLRVMDANSPAVRRIQRKANAGTARVAGKTAVPTDDLKVLQAKAKAYDALKAQTLKSQFPV